MTTDPFTTAARAEAQRAYQDTGMPRYDLAVHMAEWARTHLAAQEPTGSEVEAAFEAFTREHFMQAFSREHGDQGPSSRQSMRAALSAARAARRDEKDKP